LFDANLYHLNIKYCSVILERIEVRERRQGTLFGFGASTAVLRSIMSTPKLDATQGARVFA
jgi:hypothetical protein